VSVTAGTVFHKTKLPLSYWFWAIFLVANDKRGISAMTLARFLDVSYPTAWLMLKKIREAMAARNAQYQLAGLVQVDDAYFGGRSHGKRGRGTSQDPVLVGVGIDSRGHPTSAFLEAVPDLQQETVVAALQRRVAPQGVLHTDGLAPYAAAAQALEATHRVTRAQDPEAHEVCHWIDTVISLAKAFIDGTYHGRGRAHRQWYLEEFVYRFNRRWLGDRLVDRLLALCAGDLQRPAAVGGEPSRLTEVS
jgi:transposase-like protein